MGGLHREAFRLAWVVLVSVTAPTNAFLAPSLPGRLYGRPTGAAQLRHPVLPLRAERARAAPRWAAVDAAAMGEIPVALGALLGADALHHILPHVDVGAALDGHGATLLLADVATVQAIASTFFQPRF